MTTYMGKEDRTDNQSGKTRSRFGNKIIQIGQSITFEGAKVLRSHFVLQTFTENNPTSIFYSRIRLLKNVIRWNGGKRFNEGTLRKDRGRARENINWANENVLVVNPT